MELVDLEISIKILHLDNVVELGGRAALQLLDELDGLLRILEIFCCISANGALLFPFLARTAKLCIFSFELGSKHNGQA